MKKNQQIKRNLFLGLIPLFLIGMTLTMNSCKKTETNKPAPTLTLSANTASGSPGQKVTATLTVDSPEGGQSLTILNNGSADTTIPVVDLAGQASFSYDFSYTIPATAVVGSTYIFTFQATDRKNQQSQVAVFAVTVNPIPNKPIQEVSGRITASTTWTADKIWKINGFVYVGSDVIPAGATSPVVGATATLTIEAGTVIMGETSSPVGSLIISRGSQIIANGTAAKPIVFTSEKAPGTKKGGDWGGLVICGRSSNNIAGTLGTGIGELEGGYGGYHGGGTSADANDNSGTLNFVRIEFAGFPINPNQEINGLTLGSVGAGTTISNVQVTYANDDSFEWFGGTVNCTNLIAYKGIDDDFDTDNGFSGRVQFGLGIRDALISDQSGSNGFEADNDGAGSNNQPWTTAQFSNMTIIGPKATSGTTIGVQFQNGAHLRRNVKQDIINSIITGYPTGIYIDGTAGSVTNAVQNAASGDLALRNNILAGVQGWGGNGFGAASTSDERTVSGIPFSPDANFAAPPRGRMISAGNIASGSNPFQNGVFTITEQQISGQNSLPWFVSTANGNTILSKWNDAGINGNIFEPLAGTPTLLPAAGSPLLSGASFTGFNGFSPVTYRGAFGTTDWTLGWTNWNPQITDYSK
ncbi:MAG: Ig-like domain repeat protein [Cyclobacteriaceae bacterium]|nr:Ig-like domain repeat protein [Cyclobacteriaceae bacterium]